MLRFRTTLATISLSILMTGCSMMAPRYSPSLDNVQKIKDGGTQSANVGAFGSTPAKDNAKTISLRGSSLASPYEGSYSAYLAEAIKLELSLAGKLAPNSEIEVSGVLEKNDINIPAVGSGRGDMQARFIVKRGVF